MSKPLDGWVQTNQRAELEALRCALVSERRNLIVKSDSAYVVDGCNIHRHHWRRCGWQKIDNADLWREADELLKTRSREGQLISIRKVKGHAKARDVRRGQVLPQDKFGNDEADRLACAGADERAVEGLSVRQAKMRSKIAF